MFNQLWSISVRKGEVVVLTRKNNGKIKHNMKRKSLIGWIAGSMTVGVASFSLLAQNAPKQSCGGFGYGGPPANQQERAARQAACLKTNDGVCPNGGPRQECRGPGMVRGQGMAGGHAWRHGLRDGTGPRGTNGTCPLSQQAQPKN